MPRHVNGGSRPPPRNPYAHWCCHLRKGNQRIPSDGRGGTLINSMGLLPGCPFLTWSTQTWISTGGTHFMAAKLPLPLMCILALTGDISTSRALSRGAEKPRDNMALAGRQWGELLGGKRVSCDKDAPTPQVCGGTLQRLFRKKSTGQRMMPQAIYSSSSRPSG